MGFFDRLLSNKKRESRKARLAREKELSGDLAAAITLFREAELPDEAARLLLLRADAEKSVEQRLTFFAMAASIAEDEELKKKALGRKALVSFDVLKSRGGAFLKSEVLAVAKELEEVGELERAADAYALAGDDEGEVRALTAAGAIERLEERLRVSDSHQRDERDLDLALKKIDDLERTAERRAALELIRVTRARRDDERLADLARSIRARLARGPIVDLEIDGATHRCALGREVTIGRGDATILVASRAVSRRHVRIFKRDDGVFLEDLATRNGTTLAGARIAAPIAVGEGLRVEMGGEVPCIVTPAPAPFAVIVDVAGMRYAAALGDLAVGDWRIDLDQTPDDAFVTLTTGPARARPFLGEYQLAPRIELATGDELRAERNGAVKLRVIGGTLPFSDDDTESRLPRVDRVV